MFLKLVNHADPPANLFLGSDAYARAAAKTEQLAEQLKAWKDISLSTDF